MFSPRIAQALVALVLLLTACAPLVHETPPQPLPVASQEPIDFPRSDYEQAAKEGRAVYVIDPVNSMVTITVRRGGTLARLGHDHVVASHSIHGYVAPNASQADLYIPLGELSVDEPLLRSQADLDTQPSASDIIGTRTNMLDYVLETQHFPFALIHVSGVEKVATGLRLMAAITLHGVTCALEVPVQIETLGDGMRVTGEFDLKQSDFAIAPFSILGGAIQVQDRISLRFNIHARVGNQSESSAL